MEGEKLAAEEAIRTGLYGVLTPEPCGSLSGDFRIWWWFGGSSRALGVAGLLLESL